MCISYLLFFIVEHVQEAMLYVENANNLDPKAKLDDIKVIRDITTRCGMKSKIIATPSSKLDDESLKVNQFFWKLIYCGPMVFFI